MSIKIEEGKSYVAIDGEVWRNARWSREAGYFTLCDSCGTEYYFDQFGRFRNDDRACRHDLVAEYSEPAGPHIIVGASDAGLVTHPGPFTHDEAVAKAKELAEGAPGSEFHIYQRVGGFVGKTTVEAL